VSRVVESDPPPHLLNCRSLALARWLPRRTPHPSPTLVGPTPHPSTRQVLQRNEACDNLSRVKVWLCTSNKQTGPNNQRFHFQRTIALTGRRRSRASHQPTSGESQLNKATPPAARRCTSAVGPRHLDTTAHSEKWLAPFNRRRRPHRRRGSCLEGLAIDQQLPAELEAQASACPEMSAHARQRAAAIISQNDRPDPLGAPALAPVTRSTARAMCPCAQHCISARGQRAPEDGGAVASRPGQVASTRAPGTSTVEGPAKG